MNAYNWNTEKNQLLKKKRGISFENVMSALENDKFLADLEHPNKEQYSHQRLLVVEIESYACIVPYVTEEDGRKFLKTIFPSREATKKYL